jgi:hypothetical protein
MLSAEWAWTTVQPEDLAAAERGQLGIAHGLAAAVADAFEANS